MQKILNVFMPVALFLSATLSACSSNQEPAPVVTPAPVEVVAEKPAAPEVAPQPAPAPVAIAEQPQVSTQAIPKKKIRKARKTVVKPAPQEAPAPAPIVEPAEVTAPVIVAPEPTPPVTVAPPPVKEVAEAGFFEEYWMWLLGLIIVIAGVIFWWRKNQV